MCYRSKNETETYNVLVLNLKNIKYNIDALRMNSFYDEASY